MKDLPIVRSHERMMYKRCATKWFWHWRMGLVPKAINFGALDLGSWMHEALAKWYLPGYERAGNLADLFNHEADTAMADAASEGAPDYALDKAEELAALGAEMATAYQKFYGSDPAVNVLAAELPLEFSFSNDAGEIVAVHKFKPDLVYADNAGDVWLKEHKTAAQIRTEHLVIDDQARPYGSMAERALRAAGLIGKRNEFKGIMYNYLRKGLSDERETNAAGLALNKDGSVSKRQPSPLFVRKAVRLTTKAKIATLNRVRDETIEITTMARTVRALGRNMDHKKLQKTPHHSCPRTCEYFTMCVADEEGTDIRDMQKHMFVRKDPYAYGESTEDPAGFEMG